MTGQEILNNSHRSWDWKACEDKVDVFFFRTDVTHSIHMEVDTGRLWELGEKKCINRRYRSKNVWKADVNNNDDHWPSCHDILPKLHPRGGSIFKTKSPCVKEKWLKKDKLIHYITIRE